jgi:hypothetical protein
MAAREDYGPAGAYLFFDRCNRADWNDRPHLEV